MKKILILGAGLSATSLVDYLLKESEKHDWKITLGDVNEPLANRKLKNHPNGKAIMFDVTNAEMVNKLVNECDLAVSLLPARFHPIIAKACVKNNKNMVTASYVSSEMQALDAEAKEKGLVLLNELGVDPGIDHMSAMKIIDRIKEDGGKVEAFWSSTGGLIAPEFDSNPWNYKFTWNPRNVVMAGAGGSAQFIRNGRLKYVPYHKLFERTWSTTVLDYGEFEVYPNRDSLSYREVYGLADIPTICRGTMRRPGYTRAWNTFVQLGITDDSYVVRGTEDMSWRQFINAFLPYRPNQGVEEKLAEYMGFKLADESMKKLEWLGIFSDEKIGLSGKTPAQIIQVLLEKKWALEPQDKDMIVMQHIFEYITKEGKKKKITSSMIVLGKDQEETSMAITVGTPAAIAVKLLLTGKINLTGVHTPVCKELYEPILAELSEIGISFTEEKEDM